MRTRLIYNPGTRIHTAQHAYQTPLCGNSKGLSEGRRIHALIVKRRHGQDRFLGNLLFQMYGKCNALEDARTFLAEMHEPDACSWSHVIGAHAHRGHCTDALHLLNQMYLEGMIPDKSTFISSLSACIPQMALDDAKRMQTRIIHSGLKVDAVIGTVLVNLYSRCNSLKDARQTFDSMSEHDVVSWTAAITAYTQKGCSSEAFKLFQQMQMEGVMPNEYTYSSILAACESSGALLKGKWLHACIAGTRFATDIFVGNGLVNMYGKCNSLENARNMFDQMHERNVVSWNAMIAAYGQHCQAKDAFFFFQQMQQKGVLPDQVTFISTLDGCASQGALHEGKQIHAQLVGRGFGLDVGNALVNMYGKCGKLEDAQTVFESMNCRNVITWTAMISSCAQHGQGKEALSLVQKMEQEGVAPNTITFVGILSACSHSGLVDEGFWYFSSMRSNGIVPTVEHYNCMIDLLGRAGLLDEGEELINNMPLQPTTTVWTTLLGGCRIHFDLERGELAAAKVFNLEKNDPGPYVLVSNIYGEIMQEIWQQVLKAAV